MPALGAVAAGVAAVGGGAAAAAAAVAPGAAAVASPGPAEHAHLSFHPLRLAEPPCPTPRLPPVPAIQHGAPRNGLPHAARTPAAAAAGGGAALRVHPLRTPPPRDGPCWRWLWLGPRRRRPAGAGARRRHLHRRRAPLALLLLPRPRPRRRFPCRRTRRAVDAALVAVDLELNMDCELRFDACVYGMKSMNMKLHCMSVDD